MATTTITQKTELAHRTSDGIHVYLFWNQIEPERGHYNWEAVDLQPAGIACDSRSMD